MALSSGKLLNKLTSAEESQCATTSKPLTSLQALRIIYESMRKSHRLKKFWDPNAVNSMKWFGDELAQVGEFVRTLRPIFAESPEQWSEASKREHVIRRSLVTLLIISVTLRGDTGTVPPNGC